MGMTQPIINLRAQQEKQRDKGNSHKLELKKKDSKSMMGKRNPTQKVIGLKIRLPKEIVQETVIKEFNTGTEEHQETYNISIWGGFTLKKPASGSD